MEVWFNPSCSKCCIARDQLEDPPTEAELWNTLAALGLQPWDITRMSEPLAEVAAAGQRADDA